MRSTPPTVPRRFEWVVQGATRGPDPTFDRDLACFEEAAVLPTRGALVPEWLLIVPRRPYLSVAEMPEADRKRILAISDLVSTHVATRAASVVTFEHGPGRQGTATGCGVDQAHLHVVGGPTGLFDQLIAAVSEMAWSTAERADPWRHLPAGTDYLVVRDDQRAATALVKTPTSQRLRRALASIQGRESEWDYQTSPQRANAGRTVRIFAGAFHDTRP